MVAEIRHKLLPKQDELIFARERHTVYSGAVGAGKSRALCIAALIHCASRPKARFGLFRKTRVSLLKSTIKTLIEGDGDAPPVLPPGTYTHNKNESEIRLIGGGSIIYSGVETPEAVRSMNLTQAAIDEVTELTALDYNAVDDRVRVNIGEPLRVLNATNPGTPSHWMAKMMGLSPDKHTPDLNCKIILTRTPDNTYLDPEYIASFARHEGTVYYRRMFLGEWCGSEGMVYDRFTRSDHAVSAGFVGKRRIIGVDDGYTDPFVVIDIHANEDRYHIAREVYETRLVMDEKIDRVKALADSDTDVVVDSAAPDLIESLRRAGVRAFPADKGPGSVNYGINVVQTLLAGSRGSLTVEPTCTNTIREFESYEWKESAHGLKDQPRDMDNHAMDAVRYALRWACDQRGVQVLGSDHSTEREAMTLSFSERRAKNPEWGW